MMTFNNLWAKFKYKNYDIEITSFAAENGKYNLCVSNSVGGESIEITVYSLDNKIINKRSIKLSTLECYTFPIPSVNNPLTYGKEKWDLFKILTTQDILKVRWTVSARESSKELDRGVFKIEN